MAHTNNDENAMGDKRDEGSEEHSDGNGVAVSTTDFLIGDVDDTTQEEAGVEDSEAINEETKSPESDMKGRKKGSPRKKTSKSTSNDTASNPQVAIQPNLNPEFPGYGYHQQMMQMQGAGFTIPPQQMQGAGFAIPPQQMQPYLAPHPNFAVGGASAAPTMGLTGQQPLAPYGGYTDASAISDPAPDTRRNRGGVTGESYCSELIDDLIDVAALNSEKMRTICCMLHLCSTNKLITYLSNFVRARSSQSHSLKSYIRSYGQLSKKASQM
jgi:hypothetical protein